MSQNLPANNFEWMKETSQFNEYFLKKTVMKKVMKDIFLKLMCKIIEVHNDLHFLPERMKIEKGKKLIFIM